MGMVRSPMFRRRLGSLIQTVRDLAFRSLTTMAMGSPTSLSPTTRFSHFCITTIETVHSVKWDCSQESDTTKTEKRLLEWESTSATMIMMAGRGAAFGDLDNDGDVDIVVNNLGQKASILRNDGGNRRNWIGIRTVGTKSNRDGIGSRVKVVSASGLTQFFIVNTAIGYLSASDKRIIAGLGSDSFAKIVEITWPSGVVQKLDNVKAGQILEVVETNR